MKLTVIIVNKHEANHIIKSCQALHLLEPITLLGQGTATTELRELLSLNSVDKEVILALTSDKDTSTIMDYLVHEKSFRQKGKGVSFAIDLNSMSAKTFELLKNQLSKEQEK